MNTGNLTLPAFFFFLSDKKNPVSKHMEVWNDPLPLNRKNRKADNKLFIRYGNYFYAVQSFLEENRCKVLLNAVSVRLKQPIALERLNKINIYLEKHGEFYHPARVEVVAGNQKISFVVNVAVSDAGKKNIATEYAVLQKLENGFFYTPRVYGLGKVFVNAFQIDMFLGYWFEGYCEFHVTETLSGKRKIAVWDPLKGPWHLTTEQAKNVYRQATEILTAYYNPKTYEQIYPWHHAAGDFILKLENELVDLKLITARNYLSLVQKNEDQDLGSTMEAILLFFLNLSIQMRIDRLDGVGEIVWSDDLFVPEIVNGFFHGLEKKPQTETMGIPLAECFEYYFFSRPEKELEKLALDISSTLNPPAPEFSIIQKNLKRHIENLKQAIIERQG
ncbi:MAG: hypothetical protein R6X10_12785 [Desulfobacterales bacterium]